MYTIDTIPEKITPFCKQYMIKKVFLFGYYTCGDAKEGSDIDIRIEAGKLMTYSS